MGLVVSAIVLTMTLSHLHSNPNVNCYIKPVSKWTFHLKESKLVDLNQILKYK